MSEWSDPELQDPEAMEAAVAEELEEFRLTRSDAGFKGTEQQWRMMSDEQQLELTLDAVNRRRQGLVKFLEAEGARALELAQVLSSLSLQDVMQMLRAAGVYRPAEPQTRRVKRLREMKPPKNNTPTPPIHGKKRPWFRHASLPTQRATGPGRRSQ